MLADIYIYIYREREREREKYKQEHAHWLTQRVVDGSVGHGGLAALLAQGRGKEAKVGHRPRDVDVASHEDRLAGVWEPRVQV